MIAQLYGSVTARNLGSLILRAGPVAYRVHVPAATYEKWRPDERTEHMLWTHLAIRENAHELYGFETSDELGFFELLLSVSGIGPKSALGILNLADVGTLQSAIATGDSSYLTKVSGIGRKSAEKIIVELRDKLAALQDPREAEALRDETDTLEALQALGYSLREAREALKQVPDTTENANDKIKAALKVLSAA